jgi:hypothetical protein
MMELKEFEILLKELQITYGRGVRYDIRNLSKVIVIRVRGPRKNVVFFEAPMVSSKMDSIPDSIPYVRKGRRIIRLHAFHK